MEIDKKRCINNATQRHSGQDAADNVFMQDVDHPGEKGRQKWHQHPRVILRHLADDKLIVDKVGVD